MVRCAVIFYTSSQHLSEHHRAGVSVVNMRVICMPMQFLQWNALCFRRDHELTRVLHDCFFLFNIMGNFMADFPNELNASS